MITDNCNEQINCIYFAHIYLKHFKRSFIIQRQFASFELVYLLNFSWIVDVFTLFDKK